MLGGIEIEELQGTVGTVVVELRRRIVSGELAPGTAINQISLANELGVSRVPIRDALQWLAAIGLVRLNGRAGATVAPMSIPDLEEIFELRVTLEPLMIRLAVPNLRRADLIRAGQHIAAMEGAPGPAEWVLHNTRFHSLLYQAAGRPRMLGVINVLRVLMERYFAAAMPRTGTGRANHEHAAIFDAVRRGDADLAAQLTNEHLTGSYEELIAQLLEQGFRERARTDEPVVDRAGT